MDYSVLIWIGSDDFQDYFNTHPECEFNKLGDIFLGDCRELSLAQFRNLFRILENLKTQTNLSPVTSAAIQALSRIFETFPSPDRCFFYPNSKWSHDDLIEWLKNIGFNRTEVIQDDLDGQRFLSGFFKIDDNDWALIVSLFEEYKERKLQILKFIRLTNIVLPKRFKSNPNVNYLIESAFREDFKLMPYTVKDFSNCIQEIVDHNPCPLPWRTHPANVRMDYFAPYTVLLQSSMAGKTRFLLSPIKENDSLRVFIIYFTMQSNIGAVGHNLIDEICRNFVSATLKESAQHLRQVYEQILTLLRNSDGTLKSLFSKDGGYHADFLWDQAKNLESTCYKEGLFDAVVNDKGVVERGKRVIIVFAIDEAHLLLDSEFDDIPRYGLTFHSAPLSNAVVPLTEAVPYPTNDNKNESLSRYAFDLYYYSSKRSFDECGSDDGSQKAFFAKIPRMEQKPPKRITRFTVLRRALISLELEQAFTIPVVLTSTNSRLANFMPHKFFDPSRRDVLVNDTNRSTVKHLHRICIIQESFDVHMRNEVIYIVCFESYLKSSEYLKNMFKHGRPKWGAIIASSQKIDGDLLETLRGIIFLAKEKLALGSPLNSLDSVALLGHTLGLSKFTSSNWASSIVENKLGFLESVDTLQGILVSSFHPEPVIAVAACHALFMDQTKECSILKVLEEYRDITQLGHLDIGDSGEFVARLVFYLAKMLAKPIKVDIDYDKLFHACYPVTLKIFLDVIDPESQVDIAENYSDGLISFNHFVQMESLDSSKNNMTAILQQAFCRGSAIRLLDHFLGCDLLIPFLTKKAELTWIFVQVKSRASRENINYAEILRGMMSFGTKYGIREQPFYMIFNLTVDTEARPLKAFHGKTISAVEKSHGVKVPGIVIEGAQFPYSSSIAIQNDRLNSVICDLADCFRGATVRNTSDFAAHQMEDNLRFRYISSNDKFVGVSGQHY